ncbi:MAG: histidine kinase [Candidatus Eiseniibacteriota bacterium]|jgi:two-component system LytT family sensor kinase
MHQVTLTGTEFIIVLVLVKLGVMAALTSVLVRSRRFVDVLFTPRRTVITQSALALSLGLPFSIGVLLRVVLGYEGLDLAFSGAYLAGLVGGIHPGMLVGTMVGLPGFLSGEWLALPAYVATGLVAGVVGGGRLGGEEIWELSAVPPIDVYRILKAAIVHHALDRKLLVVVSCLGLAVAGDFVAGNVGEGWLYRLAPDSIWVLVAAWVGALSSVAIGVRNFNAARLDIKIKAQEALLTQARYDALRRQINPHFLFNTLNTISSSIRTNSTAARQMIVKLAAVLRRVLQPGADFVPLREEIDFIDSYLDIETVRFGADRLLVDKRIDPATLDVPVPFMILQPLVENAILHGLEPSLKPGTIRISAGFDNGDVTVTVEDDGRGMPAERVAAALTGGIGIKNVHERLRMAYGPEYGLELSSRPGDGTRVRVVIPHERSRRYAQPA